MHQLNLKIKLPFVILISVLFSCNQKQGNKSTDWIQLFNGKDLNDWQVKFKGYELGYNLNNTFRVEEGLLRVCYDDWDKWGDQYGHLFYKNEFSNYKLRVEYPFKGVQLEEHHRGLNGIMV